MTQYTVTATIQSGDNKPVAMRWATNVSEIQAMVAIGQLFEQNIPDLNMPKAIQSNLVEIKIEVSEK